MAEGKEHMELKDVQTAVEGIQAKTLEAINTVRDEWKKHYEELKAAGADSQEVKQQLERALKRMDVLEAEWTRKGTEATAEIKTLGDIVVEDAGLKEWAKRPWHKGGMSIKMPAGSFFPGEMKTTITSATIGSSTPGILTPDRMPGILKPGVQTLRVRELMRRLPTDSNAIEWVKENVFTNAASPTAETISKPESALTFTIDSVPVRTIAHWIPLAKQVLDDFAALGGYVNTRLLDGLADVEDYELVAGDGTGQHLSGLSTEATAYDTARNVPGDTYIDKINHAISQIEDVLQAADGIILHPRDWRAIQLVKEEGGGANTGPYLLGGPQGNATAILWGLPVATTTAVSRGTFYVGAFQRHAIVFDRMAARVDVSTEHADFFVRNMVAIRAEERIAFAVDRNNAVVYGSF